MAGVTAPEGRPGAAWRGNLARLAGAAVAVGLGLFALWQTGVLFRSDAAATSGGGEAVTLLPADASLTTANPAGLPVGTSEGELAPDFAFSAFDGRRLRLSDFRGRPVLLNFWATWCGPCRQELPDMGTLLRRHESEGLAIIAVNVAETYAPASRFLGQLEIQLTAFAYDPLGDVARRYGVHGLPTSYFIDPQGVIRRVVPGQMRLKDMESFLQEALAAGSSAE